MFIISKIVGFLIDPFLWIIIVLILSAFINDNWWKKICRRSALVMFLFFSNNFIINNLWNRYQWQPVTIPSNTTYQYGIILGGLVGYDEERKQGFFGQASDRFIQTARLYHLGYINKILVTGGNAIFVKEQGYNEADHIAGNLRDLGIPAQDILLEKLARNTQQNALFSKQIMDSSGPSGKCLLITSAVHMPRAMKIFLRSGMAVDPYPCHYKVLSQDSKLTWKSLIPSTEALGKWSELLKEWVGSIVV
ncbi:MAG TPA: YdcF family protein [Chitinophagaceae bacterium]|nr:YdcF family protein [Chitinophagaceae bacterium]